MVKTARHTDERLRRLVESETRNHKRVQERQLRRQLDDDINGGAVSMNSETEDRRYNPDTFDEDWSLDNQLTHGARLTPHRS
jgi:hypothetical protein